MSEIIVQNPENLNTLALPFVKFFKIGWFRHKSFIEKAKIGVYWVLRLLKGRIWRKTDAEKGVYWQVHDVYRPIWVPPGSKYKENTTSMHPLFWHTGAKSDSLYKQLKRVDQYILLPK